MATTLLLKADDTARLTSISGNVDIDTLTPWIFSAQLNDVRRVLGLPLYNKILADFDNDALTGEYKIIYDNYVSQMLVFFSAALFISVNNYKVTNGGVYKVNPENGESLEESELLSLVERYKSIASGFELGFRDYMKDISIPEYNSSCKNNNSSFNFPWYLD